MSAYTYEMVRENSRLPVHFSYVQEPAHTILADWHEYLEILLIVSAGMTALSLARLAVHLIFLTSELKKLQSDFGI